MSRRIVLGYSGGLDTSVIVPWLKENYEAEVICVAANVGQREGLDGLREKALATGAFDFFGEDLRQTLAEDYILPMLKSGAVYARKYLLGTAIARPAISKRMVEVAREVGADAVSHGCTGKGNDQVRFELSFAGLAPDLDVIAPWREWDIRSREDAMEYAQARRIPLDIDVKKLYSRDENLWHMSHEGGPLEDPRNAPDDDVYIWTTSPELAPDRPVSITIRFEEGRPVSVNGDNLSMQAVIELLNEIGSTHGVGRADIIEDRVVGIKSRGVYETPGGTILLMALQELEQLVLSRRALSLKDELAPRYADILYEGRWWTPEREALDAMINSLMRTVTGSVTLKLYKGGITILSRSAEQSLYDVDLASFGASQGYEHSDSEGFVKLFGLPVRAVAQQVGMAIPRSKSPLTSSID